MSNFAKKKVWGGGAKPPPPHTPVPTPMHLHVGTMYTIWWSFRIL